MVNIKIKEEFNQIMQDRDLIKFRTFIEDNADLFKEGYLSKLLTLSDEALLTVMETWTAVKPEFGSVAVFSRDNIRMKTLESNLSLSSADLVDYIKEKGNYPSCVECKWFNTAPQNEAACINLGALSSDVCCPGWTTKNDLQRPN